MMTFEELVVAITKYRLVIRPGIVGGPVVAMFKAVKLDGKSYEIWKKTETQAVTLEEAVKGCIAKIGSLTEADLSYPGPNGEPT